MRTKYKGHHNSNTQIRGTFSAGGEFLVCGSDDGWAYVWPSDAAPGAGSLAGKRVRSNNLPFLSSSRDTLSTKSCSLSRASGPGAGTQLRGSALTRVSGMRTWLCFVLRHRVLIFRLCCIHVACTASTERLCHR